MSALGRWLAAAFVLLLGRFRRRPRLDRRGRMVAPTATADRGAELLVLALFLAAAVCGAAFPVIYAVNAIPDQTQFLGLSLGLCLGFLAAASVTIGKRLVPEEEVEEDYPPPGHPEEQEKIEQLLDESGDRISRKRLLVAGGGAAATALGIALITPLASLGPLLDVDPFFRTPWRRGLRLVDEEGKPLRAVDVEEDTFYTAYPEHADREQLGAPLVVVRLPPEQLQLPSDRHGWAPKGILAYSKICTHAGCAIALYRKPTFPPLEPRPALVCPCHYSTFDPFTGGTVVYGPAGRGLPQLPLMIDGAGHLRAAGNFSARVGPSWWNVREPPTSA
jgi:ubiquinol-cytochrome c reductase iron-sulfur subunit